MKYILLLAVALLLLPACRECSGWVYEQDCGGGDTLRYNSDILMKDRRFLPECDSNTTKIYIYGYDLECERMLIDTI